MTVPVLIGSNDQCNKIKTCGRGDDIYGLLQIRKIAGSIEADPK